MNRFICSVGSLLAILLLIFQTDPFNGPLVDGYLGLKVIGLFLLYVCASNTIEMFKDYADDNY